MPEGSSESGKKRLKKEKAFASLRLVLWETRSRGSGYLPDRAARDFLLEALRNLLVEYHAVSVAAVTWTRLLSPLESVPPKQEGFSYDGENARVNVCVGKKSSGVVLNFKVENVGGSYVLTCRMPGRK